MYNKVDKNLTTFTDRINIYIVTVIKILRGLIIHKVFLKSSKGLIFVGKGAKLTHKNHMYLGKNVKIESHAEVQGLSKNGVFLNNNVTIGSYTMIRPSSYYGVEIGEGLEVGENSSIGPFGYIGCAGSIKIGRNVMIGPRVSMFAENHIFDDVTNTIKSQGVKRTGIVIEDDCWIGSGVIILDGVTIGKGSIVGAGTVISKRIPNYSIVIDKKNNEVRERHNNNN